MTENDELVVAARAHPDVVNAALVVGLGGSVTVVAQVTRFLTAPELRVYMCEQVASADPPDIMFVEEWPESAVSLATHIQLAGDMAPGTTYPFVAPMTPTEIELATLWSECLEIAPVGALDEFTDLGGDSMAAIELASTIVDRWSVEVPIELFVDAGTVRAFGQFLDRSASVQ